MIRAAAVLALLPAAACAPAPELALGQLESDRVEVTAESGEAVAVIEVAEGDRVGRGTLLLRQDPARLELRVREARAAVARAEALLEEQLNGPRPEAVEVLRAGLAEARIERDYREGELARLAGLRARELTSAESVDAARKLLDSAAARTALAAARLTELRAGTRPERIGQTRARLDEARARLDGLLLDRARLDVAAPVDAVVDSLPFEVGERPRPGDVVAVLLAGSQPHARVHIPEPLRLGVAVGTRLQVRIDGLDAPLTGTVRRIASEPDFTPYFALTERDRSRLSYVAEIALPDTAERLPEGLPVQAALGGRP